MFILRQTIVSQRTYARHQGRFLPKSYACTVTNRKKVCDLARPKNGLPAPTTVSYKLLLLMALSGEYPASLVGRLCGGEEYAATVVTKLKKQNLIRSYAQDGESGLRLTLPCKRLLLQERPDDLLPFLTGQSETNHPRSELVRRLRLHRMAEVLTPIANAGANYLPWEKPPIFRERRVYPPDTLPCPVYYTSKEVKEMGRQARMITSSRFTGILFTDGGLFLAYNARDGSMLWEGKAEIRLKNLIFTELCQYRLRERYVHTPVSSLVFGSGMDAMPTIMRERKEGRRNYFVLDSSFEHFYFLPNDRRGEDLLRLLCDGALREELNELLGEDLQPTAPGCPIENDAMEPGGAPVLFAYLCDMPRIQRFVTGLELHERNGTLICFDFQKEAMREVCGSRVSIQSINYQKFKEAYLSRSESSSV